ncbi:MAG: hypothetical protein WCL57_10935 [Chloroflexota bacterium]
MRNVGILTCGAATLPNCGLGFGWVGFHALIIVGCVSRPQPASRYNITHVNGRRICRKMAGEP